MRSRFVHCLAAALFVVGCAVGGGGALAQDQAADADAGAPVAPLRTPTYESGWRFALTPQIWLPGVEGDFTVRGRTTSIDASFADILDSSDSVIGLAGRFELGKGKWGGFIDGTYAKVADDGIPFQNTVVSVVSELTFVDFALTYRVGEWPLEEAAGAPGTEPRTLDLDLYAGARLSVIGLTIDRPSAPSFEDDREWLDPIVGAQADIPFADRWRLTLRGDVGGFGVDSDLTWSIAALVGYDFRMFDLPATVFGGYKALGLDNDEGGGASRFRWDATLHGPMLGLTIRF